MKSTRSRGRSKNNRNRSHQQGGNVVNRVFDSSGPEGKVRGTPSQVIEKYNQLARDAQLSNDRVAMENFQQHAEHYLRLLSEAQREMDAKREEQERQNRERQIERDRERQERQERDGNNNYAQEGGQQPREQHSGGQPHQGGQHNDNQPHTNNQQGGQHTDGAPQRDTDQAGEKPKPKPRSRRKPETVSQLPDFVTQGEAAEPDSGLVETPESKPKPKPKRAPRRKPQPKSEAKSENDSGDGGSGDQPEAAE
ncbi:MAG: DUF4167 domain-containing protein [Sulfitobacter sp.]